MSKAADDDERLIIRMVQRELEFLPAWERGDWINLPFEIDLPGWLPHGGTWEAEGSADRVAGATTDAGLRLIAQLPVGRKWEAKVMIDYRVAAAEEKPPSDAGFLIDFQDHWGSKNESSWKWVTVNGATRELLVGDTENRGSSKVVKLPGGKGGDKRLERIELDVVRFNDELIVSVDGVEAWRGALPALEPDQRGALAIGSRATTRAASYAAFESFQIRKLVIPPVPKRVSSLETGGLGTRD